MPTILWFLKCTENYTSFAMEKNQIDKANLSFVSLGTHNHIQSFFKEMRCHIIYDNMAAILNQLKPKTDYFPPGEKHFKYLNRIKTTAGSVLWPLSHHQMHISLLKGKIHTPPHPQLFNPLLINHFNLMSLTKFSRRLAKMSLFQTLSFVTFAHTEQ